MRGLPYTMLETSIKPIQIFPFIKNFNKKLKLNATTVALKMSWRLIFYFYFYSEAVNNWLTYWLNRLKHVFWGRFILVRIFNILWNWIEVIVLLLAEMNSRLQVFSYCNFWPGIWMLQVFWMAGQLDEQKNS